MVFSSIQLLKKLAKERKTTPSKFVEEMFNKLEEPKKSVRKIKRHNGS